MDLSGPPTWRTIPISGAYVPEGREWHSLIDDPVADAMVLFGGYWENIGQYYMNDT